MASAPFLVPIDLNNLEIQNVKLQNISTGDPTVGVGEGSIFMDSTAHRPKWHDGSAFQSIWPFSVTDDGKAVLRDANGDFTAGTITADLTGNASTATTSTNLDGGSAGKLPYQTGAGATSFTAAGTASQVLLSGGTGSPTWSNQSALSVGSATTATTSTNLAGGTVGQIPYQSGAGATTFLSAGTAGQLLTSGGAASPTWTTKSDIKLSDLGSPSANIDLNGWKITNVGDPTSAQDAATKAYVDAKAQGLDIKESCVAATTDVLPSYVATGSVDTAGAYLEASANGDFPTIFSFVGTPVVGNRVLVKNETSTLAKWNGIYTITALGGIASKWKLTRAADFDAGTATSGSFVFVEEGASPNNYKGTGWVMNQTGTISINSTAITWTQFSGAGTYSANRGLVLNTTTNSFNFAQDSNYTAGQIPFASSTTAIGFNANLHWDNSNNRLGIGTATPGDTLDVVGTLKTSGVSTLYGIKILSDSINGPSAGTFLNWVSSDSGNTVNTPFYICGGRNNVRLSISSTGVFTWSNVVNAGTAMTLDGTGLGIGGTPVSRLSLGADTNTDGSNKLTIYRGGTSGQYTVIENGGGTVYRSYGTGGHIWYITNGTTEAARIDVNGNLGIGVTPAEKLDVQTSSGRFKLRAYGGASVKLDSSAAMGYNVATGNGHIFSINDSDVATLNSTGLGIGASPSTYKLEINSTSTFGSVWKSTRGTSVIGASQSDSSTGYLGMISNHNLSLIVNNDAKLTIATTGAATFASTVTAKSTGTGTGQVGVKYVIQLSSGTVTVVGNAYTITHNLGTKDVIVSIRRSTDNAVVYADVTMPSDDTTTVTFASSITASAYYVTIIG